MLFRVFSIALEFALLPFAPFVGRLYQAPIYNQLPLTPRSHKILFIGNSLTYYNDLPGLLAQFPAGEEHPLWHARVILPNTSLAGHRQLTPARSRLDEGGWTHVVLQEYSSRSVKHPAATLESFRLWAEDARRVGAQPVILENWPNVRRPSDLAKTQMAFAQAQNETAAIIAPAGRAWLFCLQSHPEINLYIDSIHPTVAGTYLAACVLYRTLYRKPARGLPTQIPGLKLGCHVAATLQQVADESGTLPAGL
jgi:hypothetical protein